MAAATGQDSRVSGTYGELFCVKKAEDDICSVRSILEEVTINA